MSRLSQQKNYHTLRTTVSALCSRHWLSAEAASSCVLNPMSSGSISSASLDVPSNFTMNLGQISYFATHSGPSHWSLVLSWTDDSWSSVDAVIASRSTSWEQMFWMSLRIAFQHSLSNESEGFIVKKCRIDPSELVFCKRAPESVELSPHSGIESTTEGAKRIASKNKIHIAASASLERRTDVQPRPQIGILASIADIIRVVFRKFVLVQANVWLRSSHQALLQKYNTSLLQ